jgi:hypothetical protein
MYWWNHAANLLREKRVQQFGFITTNSITQTYSGQVVERQLANSSPISIVFAVPDHPWVDAELGASVRIAMTVGRLGDAAGILAQIVQESENGDDGKAIVLDQHVGKVTANFEIGTSSGSVVPLKANDGLCWQGCKLVGKHFQISETKYRDFVNADSGSNHYLRKYWAGTDITRTPRPRYVIDLYGFTDDDARRNAPILFQHLRDWVYPERAQNRDKTFRDKWWLFGRPRPELRAANKDLGRYIVTSEVAKFHTFQFLKWPDDLIDGSVIAIALEDAFYLGVLSSSIHVKWALGTGGRLEDRPRYQNGPCFDPFPFPDATEFQKSRIRELGEQLDAHRKRQQAAHPKLTMTGMYNVLEKLRAADSTHTHTHTHTHTNCALSAKEQEIHEQGLVSVLKQIHDDLDAAVADAYGWPADLSDEEILARLVALNHERAEEERRGLVRWLRPEFQNPTGAQQTTIDVSATVPDVPAKKKSEKQAKQKWPKTLSEQAGAVHAALATFPTGATAEEISKTFGRKNDKRAGLIEEILETLTTLGKARDLADDRYVAV